MIEYCSLILTSTDVSSNILFTTPSIGTDVPTSACKSSLPPCQPSHLRFIHVEILSLNENEELLDTDDPVEPVL
jgi:hypothetical protein